MISAPLPEPPTVQWHLPVKSKKFHPFIRMSISLLSAQLLAEESLPTTPFSLLLGKHRQQQDARSSETSENELVQLPLTENIPAINEVSEESSRCGEPLKLQALPPGACDSSLSHSGGIPSWTWVAQVWAAGRPASFGLVIPREAFCVQLSI